jgi:hypothetical protein
MPEDLVPVKGVFALVVFRLEARLTATVSAVVVFLGLLTVAVAGT